MPSRAVRHCPLLVPAAATVGASIARALAAATACRLLEPALSPRLRFWPLTMPSAAAPASKLAAVAIQLAVKAAAPISTRGMRVHSVRDIKAPLHFTKNAGNFYICKKQIKKHVHVRWKAKKTRERVP